MIKICCSKSENKSSPQHHNSTCADTRRPSTLHRVHVYGLVAGQHSGTQITTWSDTEARMTGGQKLNETRPT
ncbi:hypothetical protein E2C01_102018 [Portunus trituberculatus]|uniref:Uncharacterized protein n=1 Tax=Portunus trituberculatus TaxID=210409 RepID=A0A5B7KBH4_PORTR|nr:hypothetical protein [Portunus trituberculatus]